jgi:Icc protein
MKFINRIVHRAFINLFITRRSKGIEDLNLDLAAFEILMAKGTSNPLPSKRTFNAGSLIWLILFLQTILISCQDNFSFVFLPDIHLQPDSAVVAGFENMVSQVNKLHPDFVLTGGDMIYTAKNVNDEKAGKLFDLMDSEFKSFRMPVHFTMGNHETVGITAESGIDDTNPMWGKRMYESRYGSRFYTFQYKGWKFFILDGIKILREEKNYTQGVDSLQLEWIRGELLKTDKSTPLVISIHTPLVNPHAFEGPGISAISDNSSEVLDLFRDYNLKMVLEGHTHLYMNLDFNGIYYISGGSTSYGTDKYADGFMLVKVKNGREDLRFIKTPGTAGPE